MKVFPLNRSGCEVGEPFGETKSKRTIEIDEFVPKKEIDELYMRDPYYIVPDGEVGQQAFAVIREAIRYHLDGGPIAHPDCPMGEVLRSGVSIHNREIVVERSDGSRGVVLVNIVAIKDGSGNVLGAVNCFQDVTERKQNERQIATLDGEAEHRAKNILATVQAAVSLSQSDSADALKEAIEGRIKALAKVHSLFIQSRWTGAELSNIAKQELAPYVREDAARVQIDGPALVLEPQTAQAIAVALHELATNAAKYGALLDGEGRVKVAWSCATDGQLILRWTERGGPPVKAPTRQGFGTHVVGRIIKEQLKGEMRLDWNAAGAEYEIVLPITSNSEPPS